MSEPWGSLTQERATRAALVLQPLGSIFDYCYTTLTVCCLYLIRWSSSLLLPLKKKRERERERILKLSEHPPSSWCAVFLFFLSFFFGTVINGSHKPRCSCGRPTAVIKSKMRARVTITMCVPLPFLFGYSKKQKRFREDCQCCCCCCCC